MFVILDEVNSDALTNDSGTGFVLEESLKNELDSDYEPLILLVLEANYDFVKNTTIERN